MANVFDVLRKDHEEVKRVLAELETPPAAAVGGTAEQLELRGRLVDQLIIEESKHEAVEEEYFWPTVRDKVPDGDQLADKAIEQEQQAKHILNDLLDVEPGDPKFEELVLRFIPEGREHITYEENRVWPELQKVLSPEEGDELGDKLEKGKKIAPTRPHPHIPPRPGILKATGPAVAAADKAVDKITGRDKE
ncbi:MAG: hemerythrin cation binding protein [Streptosporangiaceae bacterium]|jgi:hemerythrin-like domain-containing protein|nr:hemerythrin cation binding protein [Streptosporangiaceae bacterium]